MALAKENPERVWTLDDEIKLFDLVCDFKPAGKNKHKHMVSIIDNINKNLPDDARPFSANEIWDELEKLYNLERLDIIEDFKEDEEEEIEEKEIERTPESEEETSEIEDPGQGKVSKANYKEEVKKETKEKVKERTRSRTKDAKSRKLDVEDSEDESSGLSDVESEFPIEKDIVDMSAADGIGETVINEQTPGDVDENSEEDNDIAIEDSDKETKLTNIRDEGHDNDTNESDNEKSEEEHESLEEEVTPRRVTRGSRKQPALETTTTPVPKKRTRSLAKLDSVETPSQSKRKQTKVVTPPTSQPTSTNLKRRTRSESNQEPGYETNTKDETETKVENEFEPTRPATRRSTRSAVPAPPSKHTIPIRRSSRKK